MIEYVEAKSILSRNKNNYWFGANYTMNLYRGCHHGCIYCDSRSDVYQIDNFDKVRVKKDALIILEDELKRKRVKGVIAMGAMSDPYNRLEVETQLTRQSLELINKYGFGVAIATKSDLVLRDIDILQKISVHSPVIVKITITCARDEHAKVIEPNVSLSSKRFEAIKKLNEANIYSGILLMPILPNITDSKENILGILDKANEANAKFIIFAPGMTQRSGQRAYYLNALSDINPKFSIMHQNMFGNQYNCSIPNAKEISGLIKSKAKEYNITYSMKEVIKEYQEKYTYKQLSLF
ncbi:MAG: radical SAM protein [Erysipelotrichales bacterium]